MTDEAVSCELCRAPADVFYVRLAKDFTSGVHHEAAARCYGHAGNLLSPDAREGRYGEWKVGTKEDFVTWSVMHV